MEVTPYIHFDGKCAEALEFYKKAVGAKVEVLMRFKDSPMPNDPNKSNPAMMNQVMHAGFSIGDSKIAASDCGAKLSGFSLTLSLKSVEEIDRCFKQLSEGGQVTQPLSETFFAKKFGMLTDRFGVSWILIIPQEMSGAPKRESGELASV